MKLYKVIFKNIGHHESKEVELHVYQEMPNLYPSREAAEAGLNRWKKSRYMNHEYNVKWNPHYKDKLENHLFELVGIVEVEV